MSGKGRRRREREGRGARIHLGPIEFEVLDDSRWQSVYIADRDEFMLLRRDSSGVERPMLRMKRR